MTLNGAANQGWRVLWVTAKKPQLLVTRTPTHEHKTPPKCSENEIRFKRPKAQRIKRSSGRKYQLAPVTTNAAIKHLFFPLVFEYIKLVYKFFVTGAELNRKIDSLIVQALTIAKNIKNIHKVLE